MPDTKPINANIDEHEGIAWLTLSRPEKKNALSIALLTELSNLLRSLAENDKIRCIVTTGAGDSYSSGRDLYDMRGQDNRRRTRGFGGVAEIVDIMRKLPQVTVAKVRGWCLGGGLALINGHDLVISAESAKFGMPEVIRGSYGATATPSLFHAGIPFKKAFYISLTAHFKDKSSAFFQIIVDAFNRILLIIYPMQCCIRKDCIKFFIKLKIGSISYFESDIRVIYLCF